MSNDIRIDYSNYHRPKFTFGLELEFIYAFHRDDFFNASGLVPTPGRISQEHFKEYVAARLSHLILPESGQGPSLLGYVLPDHNRNAPSDVWRISDDISVSANAQEISEHFRVSRQLVDDRVIDYDCVELNSPPFRYKSNWYRQLHQIHNDLQSDGRIGGIYNNQSTGLHVHFALKNGDNIPLDVLKNLLVMWAFWEPLIEGMLPWHRRSAQNPFARSLRCNMPSEPPRAFAARIYACEDANSLRLFFGVAQTDYRNVKIHLSPRTHRKPDTIEFREHEGTLDPDTIGWWIKFIKLVLQCAYRLEYEKHKVLDPVRDLPTNIWELMTHIGMNDAGKRFIARRARAIEEDIEAMEQDVEL